LYNVSKEYRQLLYCFAHILPFEGVAAFKFSAMARPSEFQIHADDDYHDESTHQETPSKRNDSEQTVIRHDVDSAYNSQVGSELSLINHNEHTEALIQAAARAVVASIEQENYEKEAWDLSKRIDEAYDAETEGTEPAFADSTRMSHGTNSQADCDSDGEYDHHDKYDGSASSHHEDDVFSHGDSHSNRSSLNSITDEDVAKSGDDRANAQQRHKEHSSSISRMPSVASNFSLHPQPLALSPSPSPYTPKQRPPFRTPSSVRAMQMSSPAPSIFGSPRSTERPTVSRLGRRESPTKNKTPTRFKVKKEYPLVLLHVTVLPLRWPYGDVLDSVVDEGLPRELQAIRSSWNLLKEKLGDTVFERGVLLPHPQDLYEVLEERLLGALELPVRPRAKILSCGHYIGPDEDGEILSENDSENDFEIEESRSRTSKRERWCDICETDVRYEELGKCQKQSRFKVKVYASNGLMRAGAWAAAWKEMERVDVEIEPCIAQHLLPLLNSMMAYHGTPSQPEEAQEEEADHQLSRSGSTGSSFGDILEAERRRLAEEERMREIYGQCKTHPPPPPDPSSAPIERPPTQSPTTPRRRHDSDSLLELLLEALKVMMKDTKLVAIVVLSILVAVMALCPSPLPQHTNGKAINQTPPVAHVVKASEPLLRGPSYPDSNIEHANAMLSIATDSGPAVPRFDAIRVADPKPSDTITHSSERSNEIQEFR
jgi:hypothetical protein